MKIRLHQDENGEVEQELIEERGGSLDGLLDFRDQGDLPPDVTTDAGRRQRLRQLWGQHERPRAEEFEIFLRGGMDAVGDYEKRAQAEGTGSTGGFIVPQSFNAKLLAALKQVDGIFAAATVVPTRDGSTFAFPLDDDSGQVATIVAENGTSVTTADAVFDQVLFGKTPTWRSGHVRASLELVADAGFDLTGALAKAFARRFARAIGATHITTLLSQATLGKSAASATAVTGNEILDLMASVDSAHGQNGSFLMNFNSWTALRKLVGSTSGDYLLPISRNDAGLPTLFDMPVYLSPSMPAMTTGLKSIAFGNLSYFLRREAGSVVMRMYKERYAEFFQAAYEAFWRVDGALAKAANSPVPVKYLQQA